MTTPALAADELLQPVCDAPDDVAVIEAIPLAARGLPATVFDLLVRRAGLTPDRPAVTFLPSGAAWEQPVTWTYGRLRDDVTRTANALAAIGIGVRDAVAVLSPNSSQVLTAVLAAQAAGVVAPINPGLDAARVEGLLRGSGAQILVAAGPELDAGVWGMALELAGRLGLRAVLAVRPDREPGVTAPRPELPAVPGLVVAYLEDLSAAQPGDHLMTEIQPGAGDLASYFHTGGTTGAPRLAALTHAGEVSTAWSLSLSSVPGDDDVVLAGLPLFHVNAVMVTTLAPMLRGQHVLWTGPAGFRDPGLYQNFWRIVQRYRVAAMSAVPTVYGVLAQIPVDADISSLRVAAVGAAPLPPSVRRGFEEHTGVLLCEGYGLTEATCVSARTLPGHARAGSVGQRLPYQQIKAVHVDQETGERTDLPAGEAGLLMISGPAVFAGYLRSPASESSEPLADPGGAVQGGWLDTGDRGHVDADGYVYLGGREKDLIIRGGHNIDPAMIEDALLTHPDVTGALAVGRPDQHSGEVPVAYVTLAPGSAATGDELAQWAAQHTPERAAVPKWVHVEASLPMTLVGKPYKLPLRQDAVRRVVESETAALGLTGLTIDVALAAAGARPMVTITGLEDESRSALGAVLDRYTFGWTLG